MLDIALKATDLDKRFGGLKAVSNVSIDVHVGEIRHVRLADPILVGGVTR